MAEQQTAGLSTAELRQRIFDSEGFLTELVEIPEWGGITVLVRGVSSKEGKAINDAIQELKKASEENKNGDSSAAAGDYLADMRRVLKSCVLDPSNKKPLFPDDEHVDRLFEQSQTIVLRLSKAIWKLSGEGPEERKEITEAFLKKDSSA